MYSISIKNNSNNNKLMNYTLGKKKQTNKNSIKQSKNSVIQLTAIILGRVSSETQNKGSELKGSKILH